MPKIHYFQRYSSVENTVTNNTLQLLARIYAYSAAQASRLLTDITGESVDIGIEINQQGHAQESVPDGSIIQRSFKLLIESKVDSSVKADQLIRHAAGFSNESQKLLILLTRDAIGPEKETALSKAILSKYPGVVFKNVTFERVCEAVAGLFKDYEFEMRSLVDDYIEYCNEANLSDQSRYLMRIVPCGESIELNAKYSIYFQPSDRGCSRHSHIGIYAQKAVRYLWAIDSVFDVTLAKQLKKTLVEGRDTNEYDQRIQDIIRDSKSVCGYEIATGHRFYCGKEALPTNFLKTSFGGVMGARFLNLKTTLGDFSNDKDVAKRLAGMKWE
jgi:hypothetical protein